MVEMKIVTIRSGLGGGTITIQVGPEEYERLKKAGAILPNPGVKKRKPANKSLMPENK